MTRAGSKAFVRDTTATAYHARWNMKDAQDLLTVMQDEEPDPAVMALAQGHALLAIASWLDLLATGGDDE